MQNTATYNTKTAAKKPRLDYIDLAKGVCIILVVVLHCNSHALPYPILRNLRMPLYFVLSGLFFKDYGGIIRSSVQKANKLLVPFIIFSIGAEILLYTLSYAGFLNPIRQRDPADLMVARQLLNVPMWFLLCLFVDYLLFFAITRLTGDRRLQVCLVILCGGIGWLMSIYKIHPPFYLDSALTALPYYYLGSLLRHTSLLNAGRNLWVTIAAIAAVPLAVWLCTFFEQPQIDFMYNRMHGNPILAGIISVIIVIATLLICKAVRRLPIISFLGRYSVVTLCIHYPLLIILVNLQRHLHFFWDRWYTALIILTISMILTPLLTRYAPKVIAQQNLFALPQPISLRRIATSLMTKVHIPGLAIRRRKA